jgi:uncharacterized protein (TIGR02217 family)
MGALPSVWQINATDATDNADIFPFLTGQQFIASKTPIWSTQKDVAVSGVERVRAMWSYPQWRFKLGYEFLRGDTTNQELQRLLAFFNGHLGGFKAFFYYDRSDNAVANEQIGTGNGTNKLFQLTRTMTVGGFTYTEPVRGVSGVPVVKVAGVTKTLGTHYTIDPMGVVNFGTAPTAGQAVTWSGNFFFLCRFNSDELDTQQMWDKVWSADGIEFRSVKQ